MADYFRRRLRWNCLNLRLQAVRGHRSFGVMWAAAVSGVRHRASQVSLGCAYAVRDVSDHGMDSLLLRVASRSCRPFLQKCFALELDTLRAWAFDTHVDRALVSIL